MKKLLCLFLVLTVLGCTACSDEPVESSSPDSSSTTTTNTTSTTGSEGSTMNSSSDTTQNTTSVTGSTEITAPTGGTQATQPSASTGNSTTASKTSATSKTTTKTTVKKTVDEILAQYSDSFLKCDKFALSKYMLPLWDSDITFAEQVLPVENKDGEIVLSLAYTPLKIVSVQQLAEEGVRGG